MPAETPENSGKLVIEFEQEKGYEHKMFVDDREKQREKRLLEFEWINYICAEIYS